MDDKLKDGGDLFAAGFWGAYDRTRATYSAGIAAGMSPRAALAACGDETDDEPDEDDD